MIEQLRRVVRENPSLEPFASGATHATTNRDDDARFDAVAYAREAFSRSRAVAGASADASVGSTTTTNVLEDVATLAEGCLLYTSPSPRDQRGARMPSSA